MSSFPFLIISAAALANIVILWTFRQAFGGGPRLIPVFILLAAGCGGMLFRSTIRMMPHGDWWVGLVYFWLGAVLVMGMVLISANVARIACRHAARLWKKRRGPSSMAPAYPVAFLLCLAVFGSGIIGIIPLWAAILVAGLISAGRNSLFRFLVARDVLHGDSTDTLATGRGFHRLLLLAGLLAFAYSLHEARAVRVERFGIVTTRLPAGTDHLRIVAVSDIHLTRRDDPGRMDRLVRLINSQNPDMVVMLGDLVDDWIIDRDDLAESLRGIIAPGGKYAIIGNHEVYNGLEQSIDFTARAGFTVLRGTVADAGPLLVAGVDDPAVGGRKGIAATLREAAGDARFILLLTHRPEWQDEAGGKFDLQLSGHTHGGQLAPARVLTRLLFGRRQGLNRPGSTGARDSLVHVSNGAGYWGPPVRLGAPPEIVVVDLFRKR